MDAQQAAAMRQAARPPLTPEAERETGRSGSGQGGEAGAGGAGGGSSAATWQDAVDFADALGPPPT